MTTRDVVVIGASAGGVEALRELMSRLPADFPAAVVVVLHVPATSTSSLPRILDRVSPLRVRAAQDGDRLEHGLALVAPPDRHVVVYDSGAVTLSRGPRENGHRPAVDVLFRSAARSLGSRVIGVVLSGALDDGAAGMVAVRLRGGVGVVQDPAEALYDGMPRAALRVAEVEHVLPVAAIPARLAELVTQTAAAPPPATQLMSMEAAMAELDADALAEPDRPGTPSGWGCPDCHGSLFEIDEGGLTRFRCRVGHAWSPESLLAEQTESYEGALWMALRALEEKVALSLSLGRRAADRGHRLTGDQFERQAEETQRAAMALRDLIDRMGAGAPEAAG